MSELRQDITSGDWAIIAPGRSARPDFFSQKGKKKRTSSPKSGCPFENFQRSGNETILEKHPEGKNWKIAVLPNKYPALFRGKGGIKTFRHGLYVAKTGYGEHELVITRDHNKSFKDLDAGTAASLIGVFQDRHRALAGDPRILYATTFFNFGPSAGASVWHPHYQIMGLPFVPPHTVHSLREEKNYFLRNHRCVRCDLIKEERREKKRVIKENEFAIAIAPYASKRPFEVRILPKPHVSYFERTPASVIKGVSAVLQSVLRRMEKYMDDPDLNFYLHDAPFGGQRYDYHHWHIEVLPSVSHLAGFEFSTDIYVNIVDPDIAAATLRGKNK